MSHDAVGLRRLATAPCSRPCAKGWSPSSRIDEAVRRILTLKFQLGLFDHPLVDPDKADAAVKAGRDLAR